MELFNDGENVFGVKDLVFLTVELDLGAAVFGNENAVTLLHFERHFLTVVVKLAGAQGPRRCASRSWIAVDYQAGETS